MSKDDKKDIEKIKQKIKEKLKKTQKSKYSQKYYYWIPIEENPVLPNPDSEYTGLITDKKAINIIKEHAFDKPDDYILLTFNKPSARFERFLPTKGIKISAQTISPFKMFFVAKIEHLKESNGGALLCLFRLYDFFECSTPFKTHKIKASDIETFKFKSDEYIDNFESFTNEQKTTCASFLQKACNLLLKLDSNFVETLFTINETEDGLLYYKFFNYCIPFLNLSESAYESYMADSDIIRKLKFTISILQKSIILSTLEQNNSKNAADVIKNYDDVDGAWAKNIKYQEKIANNLDLNDINSAHKYIVATNNLNADQGDPAIIEDGKDMPGIMEMLESVLQGPFAIGLPGGISGKKTGDKKKGEKETFYEKYAREHKFDDKNTKYIDFVNNLEASDEVKEEIADEIHHLQNTPSMMTAEFSSSQEYLDTCMKVPFNQFSGSDYDIKQAKEIIEKSHYGMKDVKRRINEFLTIHKLSGSQNGAIICLVGPPGVGKTSIAKSVAAALGRKYYRFSAGGVSDEAEFIGHRRTYVSSQPGKIVQGLCKVKSMDPVFLIDEVDKMSNHANGRGGNPLSTLLNILDPEQNHAFTDLYLNFPLDLSRIVFILTANDLSEVPLPLLDRMEIIDVPSYTTDEKINILKDYVLPRTIDELKLTSLKINTSSIKDEQIEYLIRYFTHESGVRGLKKVIEKVLRCEIEQNYEGQEEITLDLSKEALKKHLGPEKFNPNENITINASGTSIGLAWTAMGGETLKIETVDTDGKGELKLTGQLGDVMKESADIAFTYVKHMVNDKNEYFSKNNFHLHVPEGATPKDGPSAGITMLTAFYSLYTKKKIKPYLAMTGELTLTGDVMPIGGLKEKLYAAKANNIKEVLIPKQNEKDLADIDDKIKNALNIHLVEKAEDVIKYAFEEV